MSRRFPMTLPISRFPVAALVLALGVLSCASGMALAQSPASTASALPSSSASVAPPADDRDFDARQTVLNRRSTENNYRYVVAQHDCYSRFFVNHCLNKARETMRDERSSISQEQLALDDEARAVRAERRDQQLALKAAQDQAAAPQRAANEASSAASYADKQRQNALKRAASQQAYDQKQGDFQRKLDDAHAQAAQKAQQRADNVTRYDDKQREAAKHKADVEARQRQAAEKAKEKQQQQQQQ